jgi:hypothetical protein
MSGSELLARIARVRSELDECERLIRAFGNKAQARVLADLCDRTNDLEREAKEEER